MARAFNIASKRISAGRVKKQLDNRFVATETEYNAAGFGSGAVYIAGRVYASNAVGVGTVRNVGRPAAAFYASAEGGGGSITISGGSASSGGGGTVSGDFLPRDGSLPMLGNLDMGNRTIANVALVDGRDVSVDGAALDSIRGASLLALAVNDALISERALVLSNAFSVTDGGAGGNYGVALATPGTLSATSTNDAAGSHSHAVTASDNPGAAVSLLKTAADGNLTLVSLTTPLITTATNIDLLINPAGTGAVQFNNDQTLRTSSFDSSFPINGWQINEVVGVAGYSSLTIGKIQADELAVRVFVADEVRVDRGDEFWTKSYGIAAESFTSPSAIDGTVSVMFEDSPALAGAIFTNNDWVLFRKLEISTGITLFNLWGQVSTYVNNSDGTQNWTFTLKSGPLSQDITKGSLAIDFGASGAALIHLSVIDSAGAPYIKMRRWAGANPYTPANYTTYVQIGNLGSIGNSYYTPAGDGLYIRATAAEDQFMVADNNGFQIRGASFSLYNGSNQTVLMNNASGINLDEDLWGSFENQRAVQWWPDVSSMTGSPSLSIYTGKAVGGFTDLQNLSYIDANPTGGVLAGLSISAFGQGTANDALLYLEGGSQSLATASSVTVTADQIDLVGVTTMDTGRADQFNPTSDLGANLGTTLLRWNILYVDQVVVSGSISGDILSGQEWEYPGSMVIDANSSSNTTVTVTNQGTGTASLDVEGHITLAGNVDGVDIALFKSSYDSHVSNIDAHHAQNHALATTSGLGATHTVSGLTTGLVLRATGASAAAFTQLQHTELGSLTTGDPHTQYLLKAGGALTGNVTASAGVTIDGVDISVHVADVNAHHAMQHNITSATVHTITSSTLGIVGATATNTVGIITPSASPGAGPAVLRTDNNGLLTLVQLNTTTKLQTPLIDSATGTVSLPGSTQLGPGLWGAIDGPKLNGWIGMGANFYYSGDTALYRATNYASQIFFSNEINFRVANSGTADNSINFIDAVRIGANGSIGSPTYVSQLTGWDINTAGAADFRYVYADQLKIKLFIADLEQALAGSQIITKSVTTVAQSFVVPYPGASMPLYVDDLPSAEGMAVFETGDFVRLRQYNRAAGTLFVSDCWGTVNSYSDQANKEQRWSFMRAGTATVNTISQVGTVQTSSSSGSTSRTVTKVTGTASGHFMVAQVVINSTTVTITPPSGWSLYASGIATGVQMAIYSKVAGGSEPSNYTFNFSSSVACAVSLICLRNVSSFYSSRTNQQSTPTNSMVGLSNIGLSTSDYYLLYGGIAGNVRGTAPEGMSEIADFGSTGVGAYSAFDLRDLSGEYGDVAATLASNAAHVCITIDLIPTYLSGGLDTTSGLMTPGSVIAPDALVLDYGVSGNGWHEITTVDGMYGANSPYARIANWTTHPATGAVVRTQTGHLRGLFGVANEYGFYAGDGTGTANNYLRLSSTTAAFNNIPITMYASGVEALRITTTEGFRIQAGSAVQNQIDVYSGSDKVYAQWTQLEPMFGNTETHFESYGKPGMGLGLIMLRAQSADGLTSAYIEMGPTAINIVGPPVNIFNNTTINGGLVVNSTTGIATGGISAGDIFTDYTPTSGNWATNGSTLLLSGSQHTVIGFHDSLDRVDFIRVGAGVITLGYNGGWGSAKTEFDGSIGTAWTGLSFGSGWANYGSNWNVGQHKKVGDLVFLRGLVYRFSGTGTIIATLPAGYRPIADILCTVETSAGHGRVDIYTNGVINMISGGTVYVSLSGIVFSTTNL